MERLLLLEQRQQLPIAVHEAAADDTRGVAWAGVRTRGCVAQVGSPRVHEHEGAQERGALPQVGGGKKGERLAELRRPLGVTVTGEVDEEGVGGGNAVEADLTARG